MIIVSDTSPITNLIQIGKLDLLRTLYQKIVIPSEVFSELAYLENQKTILEKKIGLNQDNVVINLSCSNY